ncbi:hypothetical protein [Vagococcus xieshaowenii]|uniref:Uncharacterized protein n=1 Tax=Vagococcus xieshaowenii TaxID=2562451 RepID=A0AAJ5EFV1_9ENTE|nr:hypothetical protein [Vagococcus xieshaowenii]QCA29679.1 hypothetical protein E4Z98_09845 [Vagococcus xieshaowenii]TFZ42954.1 hypothetical protein E4031_01585 [Vagococcus xieshaowenii]
MEVVQLLEVNGNLLVFEDSQLKTYEVVVSTELALYYKNQLEEAHDEGEPYLMTYDSFLSLKNGGI